MSKTDATSSGSVGQLPRKSKSAVVTEELTKIMALVTDACPDETKVSFQFDGKLQILIDVRTLEEVMVIELLLPTLGAGLFRDIRRGQAPRHGFGHRVTASVDR